MHIISVTTPHLASVWSGDEEEEDKLLAGGGPERSLGLSLLQLPQQTRDRGHGDTRGLGHADQLILHAGNIRKSKIVKNILLKL